ncbi:hypothetical protein JB92DRAFT_2834570 [Gautieria morchelliformis]|nr:hypothetical protein JB92DRAFT_2834570 [Gautieria morchelliformis]
MPETRISVRRAQTAAGRAARTGTVCVLGPWRGTWRHNQEAGLLPGTGARAEAATDSQLMIGNGCPAQSLQIRFRGEAGADAFCTSETRDEHDQKSCQTPAPSSMLCCAPPISPPRQPRQLGRAVGVSGRPPGRVSGVSLDPCRVCPAVLSGPLAAPFSANPAIIPSPACGIAYQRISVAPARPFWAPLSRQYRATRHYVNPSL